MIRWPEIIRPKQTSHALISQVDLMATIASIVNYPLPEDAAHDSYDQLPVLKGEVPQVRQTHVHNTRERGYALRSHEWLLIDAKSGYVSKVDRAWVERYDYPSDDDSPIELYDLANDPGQRDNLALKHPEIVEELSQKLKQLQSQGYSAPRLQSP